jgi:hypothetical protein
VPADPHAELEGMQRLASVAQIGGLRPPSTPKSSWIGSVLLGAPEEPWPASKGRPMWPACQILVEELPAAPPAPLEGVALLTLFIDLVDLPVDQPPGQGWDVRTYMTTDGLVPLIEPERETSERRPQEDIQVRPLPILWRPRVELPSHDDTPHHLADARDEIEDERLDLSGLKVGGWPQTVQSEVSWYLGEVMAVRDAEFVLQVDSDEKSHLWIADSGTAYLGWSPTRSWVFSWQCF